jgi:uncharacterized protein
MPAKKKVTSLRCPTCSKIVLKDEPDFPFCSERCRTVDLGKWASGAYKISVPILDPGEFDDAQEREAKRQKLEDIDFEVDEHQRRRPN